MEREPDWQEAILFLMQWIIDDSGFWTVLGHIMHEWMKEALECLV